MVLRLAVLLGLVLGSPALAQNAGPAQPPVNDLAQAPVNGSALAPVTGPAQAVPPPPVLTPQVQTPAAPAEAPPAAAPPPGLVQASPAQASTTPAAPAAPPPPDVAPAIPNTWLPENTATLGVLNKVDGSTRQVSVPVGGQTVVGDLQVAVQGCVVRPPDQIPDAAIFLSVQPASDASATPVFRGWMVRSTPGAAVVGDAGETFRVIGCTG